MYLAAVGLGPLGVVDADAVELNNLQRQVLHDMDSVGLKVALAEARLRAINPHLHVALHEARLTSANARNSEPDEITPWALAARVASGATLSLLDVREPYEWSIARLPEARLVPLDTLPDVVATSDPSAELIVYCHHGVRSAAAVAWLRERGFACARNLTGGIDRWSREVDPSTRRY